MYWCISRLPYYHYVLHLSIWTLLLSVVLCLELLPPRHLLSSRLLSPRKCMEITSGTISILGILCKKVPQEGNEVVTLSSNSLCRQLNAHSLSLGFSAWLLVLIVCFSLHLIGYLTSLHLLGITWATLLYLYLSIPPPQCLGLLGYVSVLLVIGSVRHQVYPYLSLLFLMMSSSPIPPIFSSPKDIVYIDLY